MQILAQYDNDQLGDILINECQNGYTNFIIVSAFAKTSGVLRLKPVLQLFKKNGGHISSYIGCDANGTSYEALVNLFNLSHELHVIHNENPSITFHPKFYILHNDQHAWVFIGSNNLTGGGLWTNIECGTIFKLDLSSQADILIMSQIKSFLSSFSLNGTEMLISELDTIDKLLAAKYVSKEIFLHMETTRKRSLSSNNDANEKFFSATKIRLPRLLHETKESVPSEIESVEESIELIQEYSEESNEQFWFEFRKGTGGSRNILDLSMSGKILAGSALETKYYLPSKPSFMLGGVTFFDIPDPSDHSFRKDITINYNGKDYYPATILIANGGANDNGSWRIQIKGTSFNDVSLASFGNSDFVNNILVFQKINTSYYVMSVLTSKDLNELKLKSKVYASNGNSSNSKLFGML